MKSRLVLVKAFYDDDAAVWTVEHSSLPGLAAEAATLEALIERLPAMITDLIEENGFDGEFDVGEIALEVVASHARRVVLPAAA